MERSGIDQQRLVLDRSTLTTKIMNKLYKEQRNKINGDASLSESERIQAHRSLNDTYHYYGVKCESEECAYVGRADNIDTVCPECGEKTLDWSDAL